MSDSKYVCQGSARENVCIDCSRVLDSCRDRDCFEKVRVFLCDVGNDIIDRTSTIRVVDACVAYASISLDPVPFNRGFYTVNTRLYIKITFEACVGCDRSRCFDGIAVVDKKAVLYGGDCGVTVFKTTPEDSFCSTVPLCSCSSNLPTATVELADPIILSVGVYERAREKECCCVCCCDDIPEPVYSRVEGSFRDDCDRIVVVSIGLFSVVRITRKGQYVLNATEYCVPDKECACTEEDDSCSIFRSMAFPIGEFCTDGKRSGGNGRN